MKEFLKRHRYNLTGYKFSGIFVWIDDASKTYTFKEPKRAITVLEVRDCLQGHSQSINEQASEFQGMDCRSAEIRSYLSGIQRGIEIALHQLNQEKSRRIR